MQRGGPSREACMKELNFKGKEFVYKVAKRTNPSTHEVPEPIHFITRFGNSLINEKDRSSRSA